MVRTGGLGESMKTSVAGAVIVALLAISGGLSAQQNPAANQRPNPPQNAATADIRVQPVRANVFMLVGAGGNVTLQLTPPNLTLAPGFAQPDYGALVVDTGLGQNGDKLVAAIRQLAANRPLRFIFNTHVHPDHVGGNEALAKALGPVGGRGRQSTIAIAAHESVLTGMSIARGDAKPAPSAAWPTDTFLDGKELYFNGESIQVFHVPNAHTDGDAVVHFRRSDVISTGDLFVTTTYPIIDLGRGGHIEGVIKGLNMILDLAVPETFQEGGTMIIPGHGRLCNEADVVEYRNMVVMIRDRVRALIEKGMTLEQVKAARPSLDYDGRYGATSGFWTTEMFIEAVYKNLSE